MKRIFLVFCTLLIPTFVSAQAYSGECGSCVDRKQRMCADECELVPADKVRRCQQNCIAEYCAHRCEKSAPEIEAYLKENCYDCREQQFTLCEVHCNEGPPRKRALCQIQCSDERCKSVCEGTPETPQPKSANDSK